jgi:hypothetical protein
MNQSPMPRAKGQRFVLAGGCQATLRTFGSEPHKRMVGNASAPEVTSPETPISVQPPPVVRRLDQARPGCTRMIPLHLGAGF